ncbi:MAG: DUF362 domain-containing protein [bacterium]|nr:DUF362 domain-containing protein [bacterium]
MGKKAEVVVLKSSYGNAKQNIKKLIELADYTPQKEGIFLKPNLMGRFSSRSGIVTSVKLVEAVVLYFRENYPNKEIIIGDGSPRPDEMETIFKKSGYRKLADKYGITLLNIDEAPCKEYPSEYGSLKLPALLETHEYINIAKLKTHSQTTATICIKNQKGILPIQTKKAFHCNHELASAIQVLAEAIQPDLNILDAITALEGTGPAAFGTRKKVNCLLVSKNLYAIDNAAVTIMGFDINDVAHIPEFTDYDVLGDNLADFISPFKKADPFIKSTPLNTNIYFDKSCCSFCAVAFENAFEMNLSNMSFLLKMLMPWNKKSQKNVFLGKNEPLWKGDENIITVGDCTREYSKKLNLPTVKGCPPSIKDIQKGMLNASGYLKKYK